jgi:hypothetical protein
MNTTSRRESGNVKSKSRKASAFVPGKTSIDDPESLKNEMLYRLDEYKRDLNEAVDLQKVLKDNIFKKNFYEALEKLLNRVLIMKHDEDRNKKIKELFKWFKSRSDFYYGVNNITRRTDKYHFEKYPNVDTSKKTEYFAAKNFPQVYERDNRTEEEGLQPPKDK